MVINTGGVIFHYFYKLNRVTYLSLGKSLIIRNRTKYIKVAYNL